MKSLSLLLGVVLALSAQTPASAPAPVRHLVYQFGYNTKVADSGQGTGTTAIDVAGPAKDGGLMVSGTDFWWNTVRPRATNTCEVYADGSVACKQAPYALSPIQRTIFSLLGSDFFKELSKNGTSAWTKTFAITAAVVPGASGFAGQKYTWNCLLDLQGEGPAPGANHLILVRARGSVAQQGGRYRKGIVKLGLLYDPVARVPVFVDETRTHLPQTSVYNNDLVQLKLTKDSS